MQVFCKACDQKIAAADINLERAIAKCSLCDAVFGITDQLDQRMNTEVKPPKAPVPLPKRIQIENWGGELKIIRSWFSPLIFLLVFFCVIWNGFLVFWYTMAFGNDVPLMMKLFPIGHIAVGVTLAYFALAGFLNKTKISVGHQGLTVRHGPLPWLGNRSIATHDLEQLYCTRHYHQSSEGGSSTTFRLNAVLHSGKKVKLLSGLSDPDQVLYIEQEIENHLRIEDRPVPGEMRS